MRIFIFKSESNRELRAFASDPGGRQLPSKFGRWHAVGVIRPNKDSPHHLDRGIIEQAITSNSFQLFRMKPKTAAVS